MTEWSGHSAANFCHCDCGLWISAGFILGTLFGILFVVIADKLEEMQENPEDTPDPDSPK